MLLINPHQPFFGPGQWYEGHVHSGQGWNMSGANFFGSGFPTIGHGMTVLEVGATTVNDPDVVDLWQGDVRQAPAVRWLLQIRSNTYRAGAEGVGCHALPCLYATSRIKLPSHAFHLKKTHHGPIMRRA